MPEYARIAISVFKSGIVVLREVALLSLHRPDDVAFYSNVTQFMASYGNTGRLVTLCRFRCEDISGISILQAVQ